MMSPETHSRPRGLQKHACVACARRKIRCDRRQPCANCSAQAQTAARRGRTLHRPNDSRIECVYLEPSPVQRHRRNFALPEAADTSPNAALLQRLRLYEDLLRENNIDLPGESHGKQLDRLQGFNAEARPAVEEAAHVWITSPWEARRPHSQPAVHAAILTPSSPADAGNKEYVPADEEAELYAPPTVHPQSKSTQRELNLWLSLPPELRNPAISSVFCRPVGQSETGRAVGGAEGAEGGIESTDPTVPYHPIGLLGVANPVLVAHPEPRVILRLWQVFVDNVNPLMHIVHVPTTHHLVVEASWDADHAPPATSALLFAVYALAVISMSPKDYAETFSTPHGDGPLLSLPPPRRALLQKFRTGGAQALLAAGLLTTRRLDVLQAFTLLLLSEPDAELSSALTAVAIHIGMKLGLHRDASSAPDSNSELSFFEREMRVRLWWQLMRQCASIGSFGSLGGPNGGPGSGGAGVSWLPASDPRDMRLPLNVNDTDLHPDMAGPPVEHTGPTEMLYLLMKYEAARWMRQFADRTFASKKSSQRSQMGDDKDNAGGFSPHKLAQAKDAAIDELEQLFESKYLRHCDPHIPLHTLTACMSRLAVAQLRFQSWHPRVVVVQAGVAANGDVVSASFPQQSADAVFQNAVRVLELCFTSRHVKRVGNSFAAFQLLADSVMRVLVDAAVYVVSVLRVRTGEDGECDDDGKNEDALERPWRVVELFYDEYGSDLVRAAAGVDRQQEEQEQAEAQEQEQGRSTAEEGCRRKAGAAFAVAFCDLTLEAWDARTTARREKGRDGEASPPEFIRILRQQKDERQQRQEQREQQQQQQKQQHGDGRVWMGELPPSSDSMSWMPATSWQNDGLDWNLWNDFLQL